MGLGDSDADAGILICRRAIIDGRVMTDNGGRGRVLGEATLDHYWGARATLNKGAIRHCSYFL